MKVALESSFLTLKPELRMKAVTHYEFILDIQQQQILLVSSLPKKLDLCLLSHCISRGFYTKPLYFPIYSKTIIIVSCGD